MKNIFSEYPKDYDLRKWIVLMEINFDDYSLYSLEQMEKAETRSEYKNTLKYLCEIKKMFLCNSFEHRGSALDGAKGLNGKKYWENWCR